MGYRWRGSGSGLPSWAIAAPLVILGILLIFYIVARTAERPPELSIKNDPASRTSLPTRDSGPSSPGIPPAAIIGIVAGGVAVVGVILVASRKGSRAPTAVTRRSPVTAVMTPAPRPAASAPPDDTIECPNCAERIKKKANVCRFCNFKIGEFIDRRRGIQDPDSTEPGN